MISPSGGRRATGPWHRWVIGVVTFALYMVGGIDYVLILAQDTAYIVETFGQSGVAYFENYPLVLRGVWTINILGGLIAPVLLVARSRWVVPAAVTAATALIVLNVATFGFRGRWAALGAETALFDIGVGVIAVLFAGYCWKMGPSTRGAA